MDISLGVLFENSIVCYVFYAIWFWGAVHGLFGCVWFLGAVCFWFAWLWVLLGVGLGFGLVFWALYWLCSGWLLFWGWLGFCWFCLESLILAQDERWRRA